MAVTEAENAVAEHERKLIASWADEFGTRLVRAAAVMCGDREEAQDLVQETLLQALTCMSRFRGDAGPYTWLYAILRRQFLTRRRKARFLDFLGLVPERRDERPSPEMMMDRQSASENVRKALSRLGFRHREILFLRFVEELKVREMADLLQLPTGSVKSRLHYAVEALEKPLRRDGALPARRAEHEL
ncbi:MAG: sigma-70 family RNA polymerase sigma factor [Acidobacteria bacterium]|nr:MAG: sigma-70 family RNA polymerase sigma factor [Acidobacteriota bacterium]